MPSQARHVLACLFISHDLNVVRGIVHRVVVLRDGQVVRQGDADIGFVHPTQDCTRALMVAPFSLDA
jgi:ABC-type microcin C transport system duplicated ATPase subunit YejF